MDRLEGNFLVCPTTPNGQVMIKTDKTFIRPGAGHVYIQGANIYSIMMIEHSYARQLTDSKGSLTKISYLCYAVLRTLPKAHLPVCRHKYYAYPGAPPPLVLGNKISAVTRTLDSQLSQLCLYIKRKFYCHLE